MSLKTGVRWSPSAAQRVILEHVFRQVRAARARRRAVRRAMDPRGGQQRRGRHRVGDNKINFFIYYEVDGDTSKHHLSASNYGPESEC